MTPRLKQKRPPSPIEESFALQLRCQKILCEREYRFHPTRLWRLDFAWPEKKIGVEVEGGIWRPGGGAHSRPSNIERDIEKHNALMQLGWKYLRITGKHVASGEGLKLIEEMLDAKVG